MNSWCDDDCDFRSFASYTQVRLKKGNLEQIAWIPSHLAVMDKVIKLRTDKDKWDDGWIVSNVWQEAREYEIDAVLNDIKYL